MKIAQRAGDPPIEKVRDLVWDHVERSSIRTVAEEIGIGHSTLHNFINGAEPYPRIRRVLIDWHAWKTGGEAAFENADAALTILGGYFPPEARAAVRAEHVDLMETEFRRDGTEPPEWLSRLRKSPDERS